MQSLQDSVASVEEKMDEISKEMIDGVWSNDLSKQIESVNKFNKFVLLNPPIENLILLGIVRRFVEFLKKEDSPDLQCVAACVLANIACDNAKVVNDHGAVPIFVHLLAGATHDYDVCEMALWAMGNVAGGLTQCRDYVLRCGVLTPLLNQLNELNALVMLRTATWTLSNLCRGQPPPPFGQMKPALAALKQVLGIDDDESLSNSCKAIWHLCDGSEDKIQSVIDADLVPRLVQLLKHSSPSVVDPALNAIGNIAVGSIQHIQCLINNGALPILANLLTKSYTTSIRMDACRTILNIIDGNQEQIQSIIDANIIPTLVKLAQYDEYDIKKMAIRTISNATHNASHDQIKYVVEQSCIKPLCELLGCPNRITILKCLVGLENILEVGEVEKNTGEVNRYCQLIEDAQGIQKIENLQIEHEDIVICKKAMNILVTYWLKEEDEET